MNKLNYLDTGLIDYKECWDLQERLHKKIVDSKLNGNYQGEHHLILCEHPHVYTIGKSGKINNLLVNDDFLAKINATYYHINRGGDITYHGPGQLVGYPIFNLDYLTLNIKKYIHLLEETIIQTLVEYKIPAGRLEGATGVWLDCKNPGKTRKICSIGVRVSRYVTMHGFALNVNTNLDYFKYINPCGFTDKGVTSMKNELGKEINFEKVKKNLFERIKEIFSMRNSEKQYNEHVQGMDYQKQRK